MRDDYQLTRVDGTAVRVLQASVPGPRLPLSLLVGLADAGEPLLLPTVSPKLEEVEGVLREPSSRTGRSQWTLVRPDTGTFPSCGSTSRWSWCRGRRGGGVVRNWQRNVSCRTNIRKIVSIWTYGRLYDLIVSAISGRERSCSVSCSVSLWTDDVALLTGSSLPLRHSWKASK